MYDYIIIFELSKAVTLIIYYILSVRLLLFTIFFIDLLISLTH